MPDTLAQPWLGYIQLFCCPTEIPVLVQYFYLYEVFNINFHNDTLSNR